MRRFSVARETIRGAIKAVEFAEVCRDQLVPDDVMVAGVNGDEDSECSIPPLTTAAQPCYEIGQISVKMMLDRIAEPSLAPRGVYLSTRLIVRESTMRSAPGCGKPRKVRKGK